MSSGSNQGITYEEVVAYQAEQGVATYAGNSGGYVTGGIWINWDQNSGFSGDGWKNTDPNSPAFGYDQDDIDEMIANSLDGSLDEMFGAWVARVNYEVRYPWIIENIPASCRYEVTGG